MFTFKTVNDGLIAEMDFRMRALPFATSKAINTLGLAAQTEIRAGFQRDVQYHAERLSYELNRIMIPKFATSKELWLVLQIDPKAGNLTRLAEGTDHVGWFPFNGRLLQWIPNQDVFEHKIITVRNPLHPRQLDFGFKGPGPHKSGQAGEFQGPLRTFGLPRPKRDPESPEIWQRVGKGVKGSRLSSAKGRTKKIRTEGREDSYRNTRCLYVLVSKQKTKLKLKFYEPATKTITDTWEEAVKNALEYAMRPKGSK